MRIGTRAPCALLLLAAAAPDGLSLAAANPGAAPPWRALAASGAVEACAAETALRAPAWRNVARGDELEPATLVRTGPSGRITLSREASLLILNPDSYIELADTARPGMETSVVQTEGSVLYQVDSRTRPHFEVVTPYLVAGVKGTTFLVTVSDAYTSVTVREGLVEVTNPDTGDRFEVRPGESLFRERADDEIELVQEREGRRARREAHLLASLETVVAADSPEIPGEHPGTVISNPEASSASTSGSWSKERGRFHGTNDAESVGDLLDDVLFQDDVMDAHDEETGLHSETDLEEEVYADDCASATAVTACLSSPGHGSNGHGGHDDDDDGGGFGSGSGSGGGGGAGGGGSGSGHSGAPVVAEATAGNGAAATSLLEPLDRLLDEQGVEQREDTEQEQVEHRDRPHRDRVRRER
jgi:hypothetical protein